MLTDDQSNNTIQDALDKKICALYSLEKGFCNQKS